MTFETAFGWCGLAWGRSGLLAVAFPQDARAAVRRRLAARAPGAAEDAAPPAPIRRLAGDIAAHLGGDLRALAEVDLDMTGLPAFDRAVYGEALAIPPGRTRTYGEIARALGDVAPARRVGQALGRNPFPLVVPCHRVVGADGTMTGFSAPGGAEAKRRLLRLEGALAPELFD
ncbi:methylated-DNA-[protein]-cysteine S-methyltransferase [Amphiplicatus metriothermophilus]|uniref:Methylated-DNA-[protein]-cysteine S-methyltransferase n=2 Tax=Amphiplicatus metriothermophilus TaxID=1519374 RepID=A0A239PKM3_9PROT|nr:methylated-DNA-[protein]-cysteine S-methyltransferase [Amphiplicatus metriothermophilus]